MRRDFKFERRAILLGVVLLVAADIALAAYSWNLSSGPRPQQDLAVLTRNRDLLRADITRAQDIRQKIPAIQKDCDEFEKSLYPATTGYSSVSAELGTIAQKAGLQIESKAFREEGLKGRNTHAGADRGLGDRQLRGRGPLLERTAAFQPGVCGRRAGGEVGNKPGRPDRASARDRAHQDVFPDSVMTEKNKGNPARGVDGHRRDRVVFQQQGTVGGG